MSELRLGCQTITWGAYQREFMPRVCRELAAAGYQGMEVGFRHLQYIRPHQLRQYLEEYGLELVGTHIGGNLQDKSQASGELAHIDMVLQYLNAAGSTRLMYSGLRYISQEQFKQDLAMLRQADQAARQQGIKLLYHNHDWEFADGGRVIEALIQETDVHFCPDIGWIKRGLGDTAHVLSLLDRLKHRIGAMHLKDFATVKGTEDAVNTVLLGKGVAPLREAVVWAAKHKPGLWLIAEQDLAGGPAEQAVIANARYLHQLNEVSFG